MHDLIRSNRHQQPITHQELDPGIAGSANSFAFRKGIPDLEQSPNALGVYCENVARTVNSGDSCDLGHDELQLVTNGNQSKRNVTEFLLAKSTNLTPCVARNHRRFERHGGSQINPPSPSIENRSSRSPKLARVSRRSSNLS